jgi:hypothetical protein
MLRRLAIDGCTAPTAKPGLASLELSSRESVIDVTGRPSWTGSAFAATLAVGYAIVEGGFDALEGGV